MANNGRFEYTIGFKTDDSGLQKARKALQDIQNLTVDSPGVTGMSENLENAKHAAAELETALTKAYNVKMGTTSVAKLDQELKNLNRPLSEIYEDMKSIGPVGETAFNKIAAQAMKTNLQIKQGNTILNKFGRTLWRNVEWLISGNLINTVTGVFTKAYGYTKNLDESLNNIRIVTGKGADEMARFGKEAQETAARLGKGTTDITNASLIFYQQGLDKAEVDARTEVATKLANVSQQSAETTADQLTAVWNGFQAGTDDLEHYADVMTAIAANTASSSSELAGAISKVSSVAHTTGVDMEQLSAMISTVISVTRDSPETVGTAFKTIFARMDDLVEDGTDEFGVSLGRVSSHLAAMGIQILDEDGKLRDLGDTLTETGEKWSSYSREQQIAIAEQMGGKRQWNQVLALFDNWDKYKDALDVAKDSTGALQDQQDIYMESTQAHLQAVKTAWEGVYGEMMTADNINTVADAITKVLEVVKGFIQGVGGMGPIISALGATLLKAFSDQVAQNALRISTNIKGIFYNIDEQKAQQSLMAQFGALDSKLLQDMAKDHAKVLSYQKDITKEQQDYYNKLVDSKVAADEEYRVLEDKKKKLDEILATNKDINAVVQSKKGAVTTESIGDLAAVKQADAQQIADTGNLSLKSNRQVSLEMTEEDTKQTKNMIEMTNQLDKLIERRQIDIQETYKQIEAEKQQDQPNQKRIDSLRERINIIDRNIVVTQELQSTIRGFDDTPEGVEKISQAFLKIKQTAGESSVEFRNIQTALNQITSGSGVTKLKDKFTVMLLGPPDELATYKSKIQDIVKVLDEMGKGNTKIAALSHKYKDLLANIEKSRTVSEDAKRQIQSLANETRQTMGRVATDMGILIAGAADNIVEKFNSAKNRLSAIAEQMKNFIKGLDFQHIAKTITSTTAAVGQFASGIQMINNLPSIWENMDISTGEKVTQTITSSAAALGMLLGGLSTFIPLLKTVATNLLVNVALENLEKETHNALVKAQEKRLVATEALLKKKEKSVIVNGVECTSVEAVTAEYHKETAAIMANEKAKTKNIKKTAILTGVYGALAIAAIAVVAAVFIAIDSYNKETEAMKKKSEQLDKTIEENNAIIEQSKKVQEAKKNWEELWDSYKEGATVTEEMSSATSTLVDTLEESKDGPLHYAESIAQLTGDYTLLNEEIEKNIELQNLQGMGAIEGNVNNSSYNTGLKAKIEARDNQKWYQKSLTLGNDFSQEGNAWYKRGLGNIMTTVGWVGNKIAGNDQYDLSSTSLDIDADNNQLLETYKNIYGSSDVSVNKDGKITIDYVAAYEGKTESDITDNLINERKELEKQKKLLEDTGKAGTEAYSQISAQINTLTTQLENYNTEQQSAKDLLADSITAEDFSVDYTFSNDVSEESLATQIKNAKAEYASKIKKLWKENNIDFDEEEVENAVNLRFKNLFPDSSEVIAQGEQYIASIENTNKKIEDKIKANNIAKSFSIKGLRPNEWVDFSNFEFTTKDFDNLKQSFIDNMNMLPAELEKNYDLSNIDGNLLFKLFTGEATPEEFQQALNQAFTPPQSVADFSLDLKGLGNDFEEISKKIKEGDLNGNNAGENKAFGEMQGQLQELLAIFPENEELAERIKIFNDTTKMGTKQYADNLKWLQNYINDSPVDALNKKIDNVVEKWQAYSKNYELTVKLNLDANEFENDLEKILDADRQVNIEVKAQIDSNIEEIKTKFDNASSAFGKIGEGFTIAADDLNALQAVMDATDFQKLLDSATVAADGQIQLNENVVNSAIEAAKKQIDTEYELQDQKLAVQQQILEAKDAVYQQMKDEIEAKKKKNADEVSLEKNLDELMNQLSANSEKLKLMNEDQAQIASDGIKKKDLAAYASFYSEVDAMDAEWNDNRTKRLGGAEIAGKDFTKDYQNFDLYDKHPEYTKHNEAGGYVTFEMVQDDTMSKDKVDAYLQKLWDDVDSNQVANQEDIEAIKVQRNFLKVKRESAMKSWDGLLKSFQKTTDATKDNTDATKDNAEAQAELLDLLNEEIDVYHDLNIAIKQVNNELSSLQKQEEKLTGDALTKNLEEQNKLLEKQIQNYQELARRKTADLVSTQSYLESQGMAFDENGNMMNHDEVILNKMEEVNNLRSEYNSLSAEEQEGFKERVEAAEEEYEMLKKKIDLYDELQTDTIPQALADIAEAENKIIENNIKTFDLKFQIEFDKADAEKEYREFRNKVIKDLKEDDILGNTLASYEDLSYYRNIQGTGKIQILSQELSELQQARQDLAETGTSIFGDNAAAIEERIKSVTSELYKAQIEEKEAINAIENQYLDAIDTVGDKIKEQIDAYSKISDLIEHDINLIKLLYGEEAATEAVQKFQQQQEKQLWQQYDMYVKWSAQAQKEMNKVEIGSDAWKKWRSQWEEAQTGIRKSLEDIAQSIIDTYTTTIDTIYQKFDEKLGGALGLENLKSTYDFMQEQADKYLDTVNGAYAIEKLSKDMQDKINATDDIKAQQRLSELKDQEIKNLREKDKLTQYDIDRANALYDIEVKKIALKEAQQNKSKMRLRRDSQGNYSYQFVADEDNIASAAQELADAQNTLFNLDKDAYKNNLDEFYKLFTDFKEKQKQIYIDYADDAEKRQEALLQLEKTYGPAINDVLKQNANIRIKYEESAFEAIGELYNLNAENLQNMADTEKDILMNQLVPNWTNGIQDMIGQIVGEGGFLAAIQESNAELEKNVYSRKRGLENVGNAAKGQFGDDIVNGNDSIVNTMESLIDSNETIIAQWATLIDELKEIVNYVVTLSKTGIRVIEDGNIAENDNQSIPIQLKNSENTTGQSTYSLDSNGYTQTTYNSIDKNKSLNKTLKPKENLSPQAAQFLESAQNDPTWTKADIKQALSMINFVEAHNNQKDTSKQILDSISDKVRQNITALTRMLSFDKNSNIISSIGNEVKAEPASVQQNNYINADFPNAKDVYEILLAFETLQNQATQMAYTTRR